MASRKKKRRAKSFGASAAKACSVGAMNKRFMKWLNKSRTGQLDHVFLREARQISRARGFTPAEGIAKLEKKIKRTMLKKRVVCAFHPGKKARECAELSTFKPDYKKIADCYLMRINYGWRGD